MTKRYATGKAGHEHWVILPDTFDERIHKVLCTCGAILYPTWSNPKEAGYSEATRTEPTIIVSEVKE